MAKVPSRSDVESVLRGRISADAKALCGLIREVNPSGRDLSAAERTHRYRQKSRLQSHLIASFAEDILVGIESDGDEGTVLLLHQPTGLTAGHTVISELEDGARSWVQRKVDTGDVVVVGSVAGSVREPKGPDSGGGRGRPSENKRNVGAPPPSAVPRGGSAGAGGRSASSKSNRGGRAAPSGQERPDLNWDDETPAGDLLGAGRKALLNYDYEGARALFLKAHQRSATSSAAAFALVELLVGLGADLDALEFAETLSSRVLSEQRIRGPLALAAARSAQREKARTFVKGLNDPNSAEVFVRLAALAISAEDETTAAEDLAEAKKLVPSHPEFGAIEAAITRLHRGRQKPLIEQVKTFVAQGRWTEAANLLGTLRQAGPLDPELKVALLALEEHRRRKRTDELATRAIEALRSGDFEAAVRGLRQALLDPPETERRALEGTLAKAESRQREEVEARAAALVLKQFAHGDTTEALLLYLRLDPGAAARVRKCLSEETEMGDHVHLVHHLDQMGVTGGGARARAAVSAAFALTRAKSIVQDDPEAALALLSPHASLLENVQEASAIVQRGQAARQTREAEEAVAKLKEATAISCRISEIDFYNTPSGKAPVELRQAKSLLSDATVRLLPECLQTEALTLREALEAALWRYDLMLALRRFILAGDLAGGRALMDNPETRLRLRNVGAQPPSASPRGLAAEEAGPPAIRQTVEKMIQTAFRVAVAGERADELEKAGWAKKIITDAPIPMSEGWDFLLAGCADAEQYLQNGQYLYVLRSRGRFVFLRVVDVATKPPLIRTTVVLQTPEPCNIWGTAVNDKWIMGVGTVGAAIVLSTSDFRVLGWLPPRADLTRTTPAGPISETLGGANFSPDMRSLWCTETPYQGNSRLCVFDLETMRKTYEEELPSSASIVTVRGTDGICVALNYTFQRLDFRGPDGRTVTGGQFNLHIATFSITAYPGGGFFALGLFSTAEQGTNEDDENAKREVRAVHLSPGLPPKDLLVIPNVPLDVAAAASDLEARRIFVLLDECTEYRTLFAFLVDVETDTLVELYRAEVPAASLLVQEDGGKRPSLLVSEPGIFEVVPLGESPPTFPKVSLPQWDGDIPPENTYQSNCSGWQGPRQNSVNHWMTVVRSGMAGSRAVYDELLSSGDPETMLDGARAYRLLGKTPVGSALESEALKRFPHHAETRWMTACPALHVGRWEHIRELLETVDESSLNDAMGRHLTHMLGLALLKDGEYDKAREVLLRGLLRPGKCDLLSLLAIATPLSDAEVPTPVPLPSTEVESEIASLETGRVRALRLLVRKITAADEFLVKGEPEQVIALLDNDFVARASEVQSGARLARAYLMAGDDGGPERALRKLFALVRFLDDEAEKGCCRKELLLRGRWKASQLTKLVEEASAWLRGVLGTTQTVHQSSWY